MGFAIYPPVNAIVAAGYVVNGPAIPFGAFVALPILQPIDRLVDTAGIAIADLFLADFMAKAILQPVSAPTGADVPRQPVVVVIIPIMTGITATDINAPALGIGRTGPEKPRTKHHRAQEPTHKPLLTGRRTSACGGQRYQGGFAAVLNMLLAIVHMRLGDRPARRTEAVPALHRSRTVLAPPLHRIVQTSFIRRFPKVRFRPLVLTVDALAIQHMKGYA